MARRGAQVIIIANITGRSVKKRTRRTGWWVRVLPCAPCGGAATGGLGPHRQAALWCPVAEQSPWAAGGEPTGLRKIILREGKKLKAS